MDEKRLASVPLFSSLSKRERAELAQHADEVDLREGKELVHEGAFAYEFFVIEDGTAEVLRGGEHVADLGPGDYFGEMGAIADARRNATVVTRSPMTAIVMTAREFREVASSMPKVAEQIRSTIQERSAQTVT
jgi:CRP/FNR family cyclic AMP-dependent transcriptional regulator